MRKVKECNCDQSIQLRNDLHIIAKSIQILAGRERQTLWEDLEPAWEVLSKYGYRFKEFPADYQQKPERWKKSA